MAVWLLAPVRMIALAGSVAGAGLATGYVVVTARTLRAGERFPCNCLPGLAGTVSAATVARAVALGVAAVVGAVGPATDAAVGADLVVPAAALATAGLGVPLAVYAATLAWRSYRTIMSETDWVWVLAGRAGQVSVPENRLQEGR